MERPKIGILLATYNRAHLIHDTLDSISAQTYENWECIIVDDHSIDSTAEVVADYCEKDPRFSYFLKDESFSRGLSGSRNFGLTIAQTRKAEFIQFFDDDDIMHPKKLELQILPFLNDSKLAFTVCTFLGFDRIEDIDFNKNESDIPIESEHLAEDFLHSRIRINSAGPVFRACLFQVQKFDEDLRYGEEWELFLRIFFKYKPEYLAIKKPLFYYRHHPWSITARQDTKVEKIGTQFVIIQKVWDFLEFHNLVTARSFPFFIKQFLFQNHNKIYLKKIQDQLHKSDEINWFQKSKFRFVIYFHDFYLKIMKSILYKV
ncbi:glycosyltransferase family 2 protein [Salinimicrobium sp. TH3]|uniref:glycosyltransferase family 2 protein n=1 Tax=Salinimicrobium sp. TH3 TaxID=2997342 RepID=UPI002275B99C|nr:glycosyltransferase family 2 protein [Salinimicrobium sp. TH3]MCY2687856.1 glycosyltransferase family 2 protein [Salinimicrobium sp. TH3]